MDNWGAALEWLVIFAGREAMLFAAVGILFFGLDDLLMDMLWLGLRPDQGTRPLITSSLPGQRLAIYIPAWDEAEILPQTLQHMLTNWAGQDVRIYVGCYANDAETVAAILPLARRDPTIRLVESCATGPTTKGDNLNGIWAAMRADEAAEEFRYMGVVLHDAEDVVHPDEPALYRAWLPDHAMVQIPVVPTLMGGVELVSGHYADEFAEAHGKDMPVRSALGLPLPSAGVGCAFSREAIDHLAAHRDGLPFRSDSLTEDYEAGLLLADFGKPTIFVAMKDARGTLIASRGRFPCRIATAARQKARWIAGIALVGWDYLGWPNMAHRRPLCRWLSRWMLWRDRRSPLAALVLIAAYMALFLAGVHFVGQTVFGWRDIDIGVGTKMLLGLSTGLLLWRLLLRGYFTTRLYGWRQGLLSAPRSFFSNVVAIIAAVRAIRLYRKMRHSRRVIWDKTRHHVERGAPVEVSN